MGHERHVGFLLVNSTISLGHEKHVVFLLTYLTKVNFLTKHQFGHPVKWDPPKKMAIKMAIA